VCVFSDVLVVFAGGPRIEGTGVFSYMDINSSLGESTSHASKRSWNGIALVAGIVMLAAAALVYLVLRRPENSRNVTRVEVKAKDPAAELVSATGMVLIGKPGQTEWNQTTVGARLMEGDLIQTGKSGRAGVRYSNGNMVTIQENTVLTVRSAGDGGMEIGMPGTDAVPASADPGNGAPAASTAEPENKAAVAAFNEARANETGPYIRLKRIIPFGRSLELVGNVEAGSRLSVNNEIVDVSGDGSFKHFMNPIPASEQKINLLIKVTDLAGRTRVVAAVHDFNPRGRDH